MHCKNVYFQEKQGEMRGEKGAKYREAQGNSTPENI